jgi:hypothetical protein
MFRMFTKGKGKRNSAGSSRSTRSRSNSMREPDAAVHTTSSLFMVLDLILFHLNLINSTLYCAISFLP